VGIGSNTGTIVSSCHNRSTVFGYRGGSGGMMNINGRIVMFIERRLIMKIIRSSFGPPVPVGTATSGETQIKSR